MARLAANGPRDTGPPPIGYTARRTLSPARTEGSSLVPHETDLIATISVALALAFAFGFLASTFRMPAIVGYLLAGFLVGPFTPGFVADGSLATQLAEIGVILLMFGVGIHFSIRDLMAMKNIAVPGALVQSAVATLLAIGVARWWGWDLASGIVLGLALSVASTVVLLRALFDRNLVESRQGRVAVGWLIVEDLLTVVALVILPLLALEGSPSTSEVLREVGLSLGKVAVLAVATILVGARVVPWLLNEVSKTGSRELFTLSVLALAFGVAFGSAAAFGVSMALGAFLAGLVMGESDLSHRAAEEALPMRDAFAVLFFTSVGMLIDPAMLVAHPFQLLAIVLIIVVGKPLAAFGLVTLLGHPTRTGLVVAAGLAQIGEFSFILSELGHSLGLLSEEGHTLILGGAVITIALNPLAFRIADKLEAYFSHREMPDDDVFPLLEPEDQPAQSMAPLSGHVVLCGYGRVGRLIAAAVEQQDVPYLVVEQDRGIVEKLRERGITALHGDAADHALEQRLNLDSARLLVLAIPDPIATRRMAEVAREIHPDLPIVARTTSEDEWLYLSAGRVDDAILGDHELARAMARTSLRHLGLPEASMGAGAA